MESLKTRLNRFLEGGPEEVFDTMLNSIDNNFLPELRAARKEKSVHLIFLGTHAIVQTVAEKIFDKSGEKGTRFYLKNFVDDEKRDRKFSAIAHQLHKIRNVIAHGWSSHEMHNIVIDCKMSKGWKRQRGILHINPFIYLEQFLSSYAAGSRIWDYSELTTEKDLLVQKYRYLGEWLELRENDPIIEEIKKLKSCRSGQKRQEEAIKKLIRQRFYKGRSGSES